MAYRVSQKNALSELAGWLEKQSVLGSKTAERTRTHDTLNLISLRCQLAWWWFWKFVFLGHPVHRIVSPWGNSKTDNLWSAHTSCLEQRLSTALLLMIHYNQVKQSGYKEDKRNLVCWLLRRWLWPWGGGINIILISCKDTNDGDHGDNLYHHHHHYYHYRTLARLQLHKCRPKNRLLVFQNCKKKIKA